MQPRHAKNTFRFARIRAGFVAVAAALLLTACADSPPANASARLDAASPVPKPAELTVPAPDTPITLAALAQQARIVDGDSDLQCVTYAREASGIALYGNAGTWWSAARGRYQRGHVPKSGSVIVFRSTEASVGHLAVVTRVVSRRLIVASHANWLNNGRVHEGTPIEDVSDKGDWSSVRVWYTPGSTWGRKTYAVAGFVYRQPAQVARTAAR